MSFFLGMMMGGTVGVLIASMARAAASDWIREEGDASATVFLHPARVLDRVDDHSDAVNTGRYTIVGRRRTGTHE